MKNFEAVQALLIDQVDPSQYFDSMSAEIARNKLKTAIGDKNIPLIFIIGDPGVGKSHILRIMYHSTSSDSYSIFIDHPYFDPKDLFKALYEKKERHFDASKSKETYKNELNELYRDTLCTIFIDESQLLNDEQLELICELSDTKSFQFVCAMHKKEGSLLLQKKQFKIRPKMVIEYGCLEKNEILRYLQTLLMSHMQGEIALMFSKKEIKTIARYTKGNFRVIKKYLYTLMKLLDFAQKNGLVHYQKINSMILTMTALEIGLIHDK